MGNSSENPKKCKIVYGTMFAKENENTIEMPPKSANTMGASSIILNGEIAINLEENTIVRDDDGKALARIDNKYPRILVSKKLTEKASIEAVTKYMQEKGIKSINEIVEQSKMVNIQDKVAEKKKAAETARASGDGR